jgi:vacuolar-type H+-ATPase subunit I/STV1
MVKNLKEIIIFILIVIVLGAAVWCFFLKNANTHERLMHENMLFKEEILKKKAHEKFSRAQDEIEGLQKSIDNLMAKSASLESELFSNRQELELAKKNLTSLKNNNISARQQIEQANLNIDNLKKRIAYLVKEALGADERLMLLMKTKDALDEQVRQYEQAASAQVPAVTQRDYVQEQYGYEDTADIVSKETILTEPSFKQGEVLTVNREFAFLVINLGKSDGIAEGMRLKIMRDGRNLANVKVETVREHISAAALVDKENLSQIRAGDKAVVIGTI